MSLTLSLIGVFTLAGALALWFRWIRRVALAGRRRFVYALIAGALALAIASLATGPGLAAGVLDTATLLVGAIWIALGALAPQSRQSPAVSVGSPVLDFTAIDDAGQPFELASRRGRPILLKFFRGHW